METHVNSHFSFAEVLEILLKYEPHLDENCSIVYLCLKDPLFWVLSGKSATVSIVNCMCVYKSAANSYC